MIVNIRIVFSNTITMLCLDCPIGHRILFTKYFRNPVTNNNTIVLLVLKINIIVFKFSRTTFKI